jgi:hypothetical protein
VIQYFYYKLRYTNSTTEIPEFPIEPEVALELLMAANFLVIIAPLHPNHEKVAMLMLKCQLIFFFTRTPK